MPGKTLPLVLFLTLAAVSAPCLGQLVDRPVSEEETVVGGSFGLEGQDLFVPASAFQADNQWEHLSLGYYRSINGTEAFAPLMLPAGARIGGMACYFFDNDPTAEIVVSLERFDYSTPTATPTQLTIQPTIVSALNTGYQTNTAVFNETIRYRPGTFTQRFYALRVLMPNDSTQSQFRGCIVTWQRQVSPAPATATFSDVPVSHPFHRYVEALANAGITGGCGGGLYCVNAAVTRGEMAVFLAAALGLHFPY